MVLTTATTTTNETPVTIDDLIGRYRIHNNVQGKSPKTVQWYDEMLHTFVHAVSPAHGTVLASCFTRAVVEDYIMT